MLSELVFPDDLAVPIHKRFRLWMSVIPVKDFPTNFAQRCTKLSLELPGNIRPNTMKSFGTYNKAEIEQMQKNGRDFRRMLFSMTVMHAVINSRERFGSFGWS